MSYLKAILWMMLLALSACAQPKAQFQADQSVSTDKLSVIKVADKSVEIVHVDGKATVDGFVKFMFHDGQWAGEVTLDPGKHQLNLVFKTNYSKSKYLYELTTHAGQSYVIEYEKKHIVDANIAAKIWVLSQQNQQRVGRIVASYNEPILSKETVLDQSLQFTFTTPDEDGWHIMSRNQQETNLVKLGMSPDETLAIQISTLAVPDFKDAQQMLEYVREGQSRNADLDRFKWIERNYWLTKIDEESCVGYFTSVEDSDAKKRSLLNFDSMILDMAGFTCRDSKNKNLMVFFNYSHRHYSGQELENIRIQAKEMFSRMKFK